MKINNRDSIVSTINEKSYKKRIANYIILATIVLFIGILFGFLFKIVTFLCSLFFFIYSMSLMKKYNVFIKKIEYSIMFNRLSILNSKNKIREIPNPKFIIDKDSNILKIKSYNKNTIHIKEWDNLSTIIEHIPPKQISYRKINKGFFIKEILYIFDV